MGHIVIKIQELGDDKCLFPEIPHDLKFIQGIVEGFGILEGGMESGKTSVVLVKYSGDTAVVLEMSAEQFEVCYMALKGAEKRFSDKRSTLLN